MVVNAAGPKRESRRGRSCAEDQKLKITEHRNGGRKESRVRPKETEMSPGKYGSWVPQMGQRQQWESSGPQRIYFPPVSLGDQRHCSQNLRRLVRGATTSTL